MARARREFLRTQSFDRLDVTVLIRDEQSTGSTDAVWRRGSHGGPQLAYPASCVKLGFLVAAVHWCAERERAPECLDVDVRPMIVESDNEATGRVVDAISGVVNRAMFDDGEFAEWLVRRRYTERVLDSWGVLQGQRLLTKTYPTNSGEEPSGFEERARQAHGRNAMSPNAAAELMLGIVSGRIEPQATQYMRALLRRPRFTNQGSLGAGSPPGSLVENKAGTAFDTLEDIAWIRLPNGRELIVAAFSNGWDPREGGPWDVVRFGGLTERLIDELGLARGLPPRRVHANAKPVKSASGVQRATWRIRAPRTARYELALWYESAPRNTPQACYRIGAPGATERGEALIEACFDQRIWGSRWLPLGQVELRRAEHAEVLIEATSPGQLVPGRLAVTEVPENDLAARGLHFSAETPSIELDRPRELHERSLR